MDEVRRRQIASAVNTHDNIDIAAFLALATTANGGVIDVKLHQVDAIPGRTLGRHLLLSALGRLEDSGLLQRLWEEGKVDESPRQIRYRICAYDYLDKEDELAG